MTKLVGEPPPELTCLRPAELALVAANRILTHAFVLHSNTHDGIYGWHSLFENKVDTNVSNTQYLLESGLKGEIVCVLVGPFESSQYDATARHFSVRPEVLFKA